MPFKLVIALSNEAQKHFKLQQQNITSNASQAGLVSANIYHIDLLIEINDSSQDTQNKLKDILKVLDVSHIKFFDHNVEFISDRIIKNTKIAQVDALVDEGSIQRIQTLRDQLITVLKSKIPFTSLIATPDWIPNVPLFTYQNNVSLPEIRTKFKNTFFKIVSVSAKAQQTTLFSEPLLQLIPKERTFDGKSTRYKDYKFTTFQDCLGKRSMYGSTENLDVDLGAFRPPPKNN